MYIDDDYGHAGLPGGERQKLTDEVLDAYLKARILEWTSNLKSGEKSGASGGKKAFLASWVLVQLCKFSGASAQW